jgi:hypothetical protein
VRSPNFVGVGLSAPIRRARRSKAATVATAFCRRYARRFLISASIPSAAQRQKMVSFFEELFISALFSLFSCFGILDL